MRCDDVILRLSEKELVELVKSKKNCHMAAMAQLYEQNFPKILEYVKRRLGRGYNQAEFEQIAQDVLLIMQEKLHTYTPRPDKPLLAWLYRIAFHEIIHFREQWKDGEEQNAFRETSFDEDTFAAQDRDMSNVNTSTTYDQLIDLAAKHLSDYLFNVFEMTLQGYTANEIGERLGRTEGTIKVARNRYRAKLQKVVAKQDFVVERDDGTIRLRSFGVLFLLRSLGDAPQYDAVHKLGKLIQGTRRAKGITLEALASDASVSQGVLSAMEHGLLWPENIKPEWLNALSEALSIDLQGEISGGQIPHASKWDAIRSGLYEYRWFVFAAIVLFVIGILLLVQGAAGAGAEASEFLPGSTPPGSTPPSRSNSPVVIITTPTATSASDPTATPQYTPSPTTIALSTPTEVLTPTCILTVNSTSLRGGPATHFPIIRYISGDDENLQIFVIAQDPGTEWYEVRLNSGAAGWLSYSVCNVLLYGQILSTPSFVPATYTPTPSPTPTPIIRFYAEGTTLIIQVSNIKEVYIGHVDESWSSDPCCYYFEEGLAVEDERRIDVADIIGSDAAYYSLENYKFRLRTLPIEGDPICKYLRFGPSEETPPTTFTDSFERPCSYDLPDEN